MLQKLESKILNACFNKEITWEEKTIGLQLAQAYCKAKPPEDKNVEGAFNDIIKALRDTTNKDNPMNYLDKEQISKLEIESMSKL